MVARNGVSSCSLQHRPRSRRFGDPGMQGGYIQWPKEKMPEEIALKEVVQFLFTTHDMVRPDHEDNTMIL